MKYPCLFFTKKFLSFGSKDDQPVFSDNNVYIKKKIGDNKYLFKLGSSDSWDVIFILDSLGTLYKVSYIKYNLKWLSYFNFSTAEGIIDKVNIQTAGDMKEILKNWYSNTDKDLSFSSHFMTSLKKLPSDKPFNINELCNYIPGICYKNNINN